MKRFDFSDNSVLVSPFASTVENRNSILEIDSAFSSILSEFLTANFRTAWTFLFAVFINLNGSPDPGENRFESTGWSTEWEARDQRHWVRVTRWESHHETLAERKATDWKAMAENLQRSEFRILNKFLVGEPSTLQALNIQKRPRSAENYYSTKFRLTMCNAHCLLHYLCVLHLH